jgi:hypothetical protein
MTSTRKLPRLIAAAAFAVLVLGGAASASAAPKAATKPAVVKPAPVGLITWHSTSNCPDMEHGM